MHCALNDTNNLIKRVVISKLMHSELTFWIASHRKIGKIMKRNKVVIAVAVLLLGAAGVQSALVKPSGLTVFKNWNFDGDGVTGGTVDSGTSGTDWIKNSADSVLAQFNGGTYGVAFTNASKDSNLYVDTAAGTLTYQSPVINQTSRFRLNFDTAKTAGWYDMRALAEKITGSSTFTAQVRFLGASGAVLAEINIRGTNDLRFTTYTVGATNDYNLAGSTEKLGSYNDYQVAWENQKISFFFDDEARGGVNATNWSNLAISGDVTGIQWTITTSGSAGKVTVDKMDIEVIPEPATIGMFGLGAFGVMIIRRLRL